MSMEPIQRQMTNPIAGVVGTPALLQDTVTLLTFIQLNVPNTILDMYNSPDPGAATDFYTYELQKNSISTGRNFFSTAMSTASAGRAASLGFAFDVHTYRRYEQIWKGPAPGHSADRRYGICR